MYPAACRTVSTALEEEVTGVARTVCTSGIEAENKRTAATIIPSRAIVTMPTMRNRLDHFGSSGSFCERSIRRLCRSPYLVSSAIGSLVSQCTKNFAARRMPSRSNSSEQSHRDSKSNCGHQHGEGYPNAEHGFAE